MSGMTPWPVQYDMPLQAMPSATAQKIYPRRFDEFSHQPLSYMQLLPVPTWDSKGSHATCWPCRFCTPIRMQPASAAMVQSMAVARYYMHKLLQNTIAHHQRTLSRQLPMLGLWAPAQQPLDYQTRLGPLGTLLTELIRCSELHVVSACECTSI